MEEQSKKEELLAKKLLQEAGLEKPSFDFTTNVIKAIEAKTATTKVYQPLITKPTLVIIALVLIASCIGLFFITGTESSLLGKFDVSAKLPSFNFPQIQVSKTTLYSIGFMLLFLIQVPFLKRFVVKQYSD